MSRIAVIDTETTWDDDVMSIGVVVADDRHFSEIAFEYYIIDPIYKKGGMFSNTLMIRGLKPNVCSRRDAIMDIRRLLISLDVSKIFAYNACFDKRHLPELFDYTWHDIMKVAAYKQYNKKIPDDMNLCRTGRIRSGYGVEEIIRLLSGNAGYCEYHNAVMDAKDELKLMQLLNLPISMYSHTTV